MARTLLGESDMKKNLFCRTFEVAVMVIAASLLMVNIGLAEKNSLPDQVDINKANVKELAAVSGLGQKKAEAIITYRSQNGMFKNIEDLMNVKGIGKKTFEKIKEHITVGGDQTG